MTCAVAENQMIENTATYDFLIENENHPRIALENAIRQRAQGCCRQSLHALNTRERKGLQQSYSYSARVRAMTRRRASARAKTEASENLPSAARLPAGMPVRISMPSSTVETG